MTNPECKDACPLKKRCPKQLLFDKYHTVDISMYHEISKRPEHRYDRNFAQIPPAIDAHFFATMSVKNAIKEICDGPLLLGQKQPWTKYLGLGNIVKLCGADQSAIRRAEGMIDSLRAGTTDCDPNFSDHEEVTMDDEGKIVVLRRVPEGLGNVAIVAMLEYPLYRPIEIEHGGKSSDWPLLQDS